MEHHLHHHQIEDFQLDRQRAVGGIGDLRFERRQFRRGEAHGVGHGLAMDEARLRGVRAVHRGLMVRGHLDIEPERVVVPDLERPYPGLLDQATLHLGDHAPGFLRQRPHLVQFRIAAAAHEAAVALQQRQLVIQRLAQILQEPRRQRLEIALGLLHLLRQFARGQRLRHRRRRLQSACERAEGRAGRHG